MTACQVSGNNEVHPRTLSPWLTHQLSADVWVSHAKMGQTWARSSEPGIVFADCIKLLHLELQRLYNLSDFGTDYLVMSISRVFAGVIGRECLLWPVCSVGKTVRICSALFCTSRWNLPIIPGISWLPSFAFQYPMMKRTSFLSVSSMRSPRSS